MHCMSFMWQMNGEYRLASEKSMCCYVFFGGFLVACFVCLGFLLVFALFKSRLTWKISQIYRNNTFYQDHT